ncbi:unnamed protein product [Rotaria magnacalcarata]
MIALRKEILIVFIIYTIVIVHGNRARRHRRQTLNGPANKNSLSPNRQILNDQEQRSSPREKDPKEIASRKQDTRQFYPYDGQYGYGSGGWNYPYGGAGLGSYQYGYGQYGQGLGQYGSSYNRYPGSYGGYAGYNNRPGYYSSNYYPSLGSNYYVKDNPLHFWSSELASIKFPVLKCLARKLYSIPATSAGTERLFSYSGIILNNKRQRLSPDQLDNIHIIRSARKVLGNIQKID